MPASAEEYRSAARLFASGVTIVTVSIGTELHGMTASSFAAVSLQPPLIMISLDESSRTRVMIHDAGTFGVNILSRDQEGAARAFALPGEKPFDRLPHTIAEGGAPLLNDALVAMTCRTTDVVRAGDHEIFIAEVLAVTEQPGEPLLYFDRDYRTLSAR